MEEIRSTAAPEPPPAPAPAPRPDPGPSVPRPAEEQRSLKEHYRWVAGHAGSLVVFLGAGANADDRGGPWRAGSGMLPDDQDLAMYLASLVGREDTSPHLAEIAQYAGARFCERELFDWVTQALTVDAGPGPGPVYRYLAQLPKVLGNRYQLIVTPNYDAALETAFRDAGQEFEWLFTWLPAPSRTGGSFLREDLFTCHGEGTRVR
jgi:hypothetical protein